MLHSKKQRILVLAHKGLIPPDGAKPTDAKTADWKTEFDVLRALRKLGHDVMMLGVEDELSPIRKTIFDFKPHIAFNLLEDFDGVSIFDQNVVSYLELLKVAYTGCNPRGLMLAKDKALSKKILHYHRIPTPKFMVFPRNRRVRIPKKIKYPLIVKSLTEEASFGISQSSVVHDDKKLLERINFLHRNLQTDVIAESFIQGRELYVGVLGNFRTEILPVWELVFKNPPEQMKKIATHRVKWNPEYRKKYGITSGEAKNLTDDQREAISHLCKRVYRILGLNGYARFDLRLTPEGEIYLLEANPNPHIGYGEDFAESAELVGLFYPTLIQKILNLGLRWLPSEVAPASTNA